ncbi:MAG: hypothetical protein WAL95_03080 [Candidatus Acidiferrales bacterium]
MTYWVQFMEERRWMPGTVLVIPSDVPPFVHFVMVEFVDFNTGVEYAIHNMPGIGVARALLDDVIGGKPVRAWWMPPTREAGEAAILRLRSLIGHPYHITEANCEHVIRWAVTGVWKSEQVSAVQIGLLIAGAVAVAASLQRGRGARRARR